ncbi:CUN004 bro-like protein [Culex nigripalpus nucleopolyhedrovirus]|uniref:CUN004 bro-like protein n=1 Tax=Culex nigripalpus nucleopolyhedrovirus (isolate Florida/1997) TaxID=645993 RepID=Q919R1_NPVCO|nr:CUN004 bro-like protein [Culex nigripalpus nucleopolyhedrovirus]AAK94082.1 CUN004 bro-like protein [Culex nigripalpus nucleopolyhedrovirus]
MSFPATNRMELRTIEVKKYNIKLTFYCFTSGCIWICANDVIKCLNADFELAMKNVTNYMQWGFYRSSERVDLPSDWNHTNVMINMRGLRELLGNQPYWPQLERAWCEEFNHKPLPSADLECRTVHRKEFEVNNERFAVRYCFNSDTNERWLSVEDLAAMLGYKLRPTERFITTPGTLFGQNLNPNSVADRDIQLIDETTANLITIRDKMIRNDKIDRLFNELQFGVIERGLDYNDRYKVTSNVRELIDFNNSLEVSTNQFDTLKNDLDSKIRAQTIAIKLELEKFCGIKW